MVELRPPEIKWSRLKITMKTGRRVPQLQNFAHFHIASGARDKGEVLNGLVRAYPSGRGFEPATMV